MKAVIAGYARSPFQFAKKGGLATLRPDELAAQVVRGLLSRTNLDPELIDDVILGCAYPEGPQGNNLARIVGLLAGLPFTVPGTTVNRFCGSSMQAIHMAAANIEAGMGDAFLCVGVESMTMVPQGGLSPSPNPQLKAASNTYVSMGETAENVAERWGVSRGDQEAFAVHSHQKAAAARAEGRLASEIIAIRTPEGDVVSEDGCIRPGTSLETLANLRPAFRLDGVVTAATSSPLTDGAVAVFVTSEEFAARHNLPATARIRSFAVAGVSPEIMGAGPIPATRKALARASLDASQLGIVEINEAFASQAIACMRDLELDPVMTNLDGGGISIGHPLGATGARITAKAAALLQRENLQYALATQCVGGGQGIATVLERL